MHLWPDWRAAAAASCRTPFRAASYVSDSSWTALSALVHIMQALLALPLTQTHVIARSDHEKESFCETHV